MDKYSRFEDKFSPNGLNLSDNLKIKQKTTTNNLKINNNFTSNPKIPPPPGGGGDKINPIGGIFSELEELIGGIFLMKSKNKCPQEAPSGLGGAKFTPIGGIFFVQKPP